MGIKPGTIKRKAWAGIITWEFGGVSDGLARVEKDFGYVL